MEALKANVTAGFGTGAGGSIGLTIENDPNLLGAGDLDIHLLLFPAVAATLAVSDGAVRTGNTRPIKVDGGIATFSGGNTASLPKLPVFSHPTLQVLFSFDVNGQPTPASIRFDPVSMQLKADRPCYAAVRYSEYKTSALEIIYTPLVENVGVGSKTTFGIISAFYPPNNIAVYQTQPFNVNLGEDRVELYRIVRQVVRKPWPRPRKSSAIFSTPYPTSWNGTAARRQRSWRRWRRCSTRCGRRCMRRLFGTRKMPHHDSRKLSKIADE